MTTLTTHARPHMRKPAPGETVVRSIRSVWDGRYLSVRWTDPANYPQVHARLVHWNGAAWMQGEARLTGVHNGGPLRSVPDAVSAAIAAFDATHEIACRDACGRPMYSDGTGGLRYDRAEAQEQANRASEANVRAYREFLHPFGGSLSLG